MDEFCIHELRPAECTICNGHDARARSQPPPRAERYADVVFDLIPLEADGWISRSDLAEAAGLSGAQVSAAVAYLRDNYPELPLVSCTQGYCYTLNEADINRFRLARTRSALTTYRRLWRGVIKPFLDKGVEQGSISHSAAAWEERQFNRLLEDLSGMAS